MTTATYVVGWSPFHRDGGALELACRLARSGGRRLHVVSVLPSGWGNLARRGHEADAAEEGARAAAEARSYLEAAGVEGDVVCTFGRSVPQVLLDAVEATSAKMLVLGSGTDTGLGRIDVSSKVGRLLHSSPVAVGLAPRGHRAQGTRVDRVTCAFRDVESSRRALSGAAHIAGIYDADLRAVTFGVEPRRMYPAEVSGAEEMVLDTWRRQASSALETAVRDLDTPVVDTEIAVGRSWDDALHGVTWDEGDLLVVGSSSTIRLAQVFLGSSATKIVQHSPVPVVVLPGGRV